MDPCYEGTKQVLAFVTSSRISSYMLVHMSLRVVRGPGWPHNTTERARTPQGAPMPAQTLKRTRATPPPAPWRPQGGPAEAETAARDAPDGP